MEHHQIHAGDLWVPIMAPDGRHLIGMLSRDVCMRSQTCCCAVFIFRTRGLLAVCQNSNVEQNLMHFWDAALGLIMGYAEATYGSLA